MSQFFRKPPRFFRSLWAMVLVALAIRLVVVAFAYPLQLDPDKDFQEFGWEIGKVAKSLATGHGFSSPIYGPTGPTAWLPPMYTYLLGGVFRLFGVYSAKSAIAILAINSLFAALTCIPIVAIARRTGGESTAIWAGWLWVVFPYSIYFSGVRVWQVTLDALLVSLVFLAALGLRNTKGIREWLLFGLIAGVAALSITAIMACVPFLLGWAASLHWKRGRRWLLPAALAVVVMSAALSPWMIRNWLVFHRFIPVRDNFWVEVRLGNTGEPDMVIESDHAHPATDAREWQALQQLGELGYSERQKQISLDYIRQNPGDYAWMVVRRIVYTWTGFWSLHPRFLREEPTGIPNFFLCTALTMLLAIGLHRLWKSDAASAWAYLLVFLAFPITYYLTHSKMDYRHPIEPLMVVLCVYTFTSRTGEPKAAALKPEMLSESENVAV